jgi:serine-type D-Ala-D-Ala carboxypeptidase (penicillin-binding protein 5/6)
VTGPRRQVPAPLRSAAPSRPAAALSALLLALSIALTGPSLALAQTDADPDDRTQAGGDASPDETPQPAAGPSAVSPYATPEPPVFGPAPAGWPSPPSAPGAAYVLMDAETGQVLAARDATEPRPVASTVKVLTALSVIARTELDDPVTVGDEVQGVAGAGVGLAPGDTWRVEQLLDAVISRSGNEAAEALATHVGGDAEGFIAMMLADAAALGLGEPVLVSPSGLDDTNQLSAMDLAALARAALAEPDLRPFFARREVVLPSVGRIETRNQLLLSYPDATGVKTGYTRAAGYGLIGSAQRDGRELIAVVLDAGEEPARFLGAASLLDLGFDAYRPAVLEARAVFAVAGGERVLQVPPTPVLTPTRSRAELKLPVTARPPEADVQVDIEVEGDTLATVTGRLDATGLPPTTSDEARIGRAAVDGAYAALRAAAAGDVLR